MLFTVLLQCREAKGYKSNYLDYDGDNVDARVKVMSRTFKKLCIKVDAKILYHM